MAGRNIAGMIAYEAASGSLGTIILPNQYTGTSRGTTSNIAAMVQLNDFNLPHPKLVKAKWAPLRPLFLGPSVLRPHLNRLKLASLSATRALFPILK